MRFQVPQFTDVEDKVIGPLTFKQFIYLAGGAGASIVLFTFLPIWIALPIVILLGIFSASLAFYKVNNRPFIRVVESFLRFKVKEKLYIWKHEPKPLAERAEQAKKAVFVPKLSESKLRDLTWTLDVKENLNPVTKDDEEIGLNLHEGMKKPKLEGWE